MKGPFTWTLAKAVCSNNYARIPIRISLQPSAPLSKLRPQKLLTAICTLYFILLSFKPSNDILCIDCSGTLTFQMRLSFASLILCQVRHKIEGDCTTREPVCLWQPFVVYYVNVSVEELAAEAEFFKNSCLNSYLKSSRLPFFNKASLVVE